MDSSELQQLVSSVGDAILARLERGAARPPVACRLSKRQAAALIDHTILRPDATPADVRKVCREAIEYQFASVCVNGVFVPLVAAELAGSSVKVCSVVGFPLGAMPTKAKMAETELAIRAGASEIDMVLPVGLLKAGDLEAVKGDVAALAEVCARGGAILKVILETCLLNEYEKAVACVLSKLAGAQFVKTSTGFSKGGATKEDVALMRRVVGAEMGVKASGGIRTLDDLLAMVDAGASRIGASAGVQIVESIAC